VDRGGGLSGWVSPARCGGWVLLGRGWDRCRGRLPGVGDVMYGADGGGDSAGGLSLVGRYAWVGGGWV